MHTFAQKLFLLFGLRRWTAKRRTPSALQVDSRSNILPLVRKTRAVQQPVDFRVGTEVREGEQFITPLANEPRTA